VADDKQPGLFGEGELERHRREVADEELSAWIDGELDRQAAARIERQVAADPELRARADAFRSLQQSLRELPPPPRTEARVAALRERVLDAAAAADEAEDRADRDERRSREHDDSGATIAPINARSWIAPAIAALAAGLAVYFLIPGPTEVAPPPEPEAELAAASIETATEEELAIALTLETFSPEDYDVVANLELLELMDRMEGGAEGGPG